MPNQNLLLSDCFWESCFRCYYMYWNFKNLWREDFPPPRGKGTKAFFFFLVGGMWPWASWSQLTNKAHDSRKRTSQLLNYSCLCTVYMTSSTSGWPTSNCPSTNLRQRAECECACRGYWKKWCCWSTLLFSEQGCQDTCFDSHHPSSLLEARSNSPECNVNPWMDVNRTHVASITLFFLSLDV